MHKLNSIGKRIKHTLPAMENQTINNQNQQSSIINQNHKYLARKGKIKQPRSKIHKLKPITYLGISQSDAK